MFLLTDALLILLDDVTDGLVVFPAMIRSQLEQEIPFMATENIIMKLVHQGVSRQEAHERIRVLSRETIWAVKEKGGKNDLIERIKGDEFFVSLLLDIGYCQTDYCLHRSLFGTNSIACWTPNFSLAGLQRSLRGILEVMDWLRASWRSTTISLSLQLRPCSLSDFYTCHISWHARHADLACSNRLTTATASLSPDGEPWRDTRTTRPFKRRSRSI